MSHYEYGALRATVRALFSHHGFDDGKADSIAEVLIEADLLGHATHGLALVPWYMEMVASNLFTKTGEPDVISDRGACVAWNGKRIPGTWLVQRALDLALERAPTYGTVTVSIAASQHIAALVPYLPRATDRGFMVLLASSSPGVATVAPFGGTRPVMTPNPIAAGIPTDGDPILLDVSASITTNNYARQLMREGKRFPHAWAMDAAGNATDDPKVVLEGGGSILPIGGIDHGHKGYGLGLIVEALTQGLSGLGRADPRMPGTSSVYLQVIDPTAFAGQDAFKRQTSWLAAACRDNPPRPGVERVRVPGDQAMRRKRAALANGVPLSPAIVAGLKPHLDKAGLTLAGP
jgi:LDH2 family malate/lactate/ureidoglycolate dehydrogenase